MTGESSWNFHPISLPNEFSYIFWDSEALKSSRIPETLFDAQWPESFGSWNPETHRLCICIHKDAGRFGVLYKPQNKDSQILSCAFAKSNYTGLKLTSEIRVRGGDREPISESFAQRLGLKCKQKFDAILPYPEKGIVPLLGYSLDGMSGPHADPSFFSQIAKITGLPLEAGKAKRIGPD